MKKSKIDLKFEKMSRECADSMVGTGPRPRKTSKKSVKKVSKKK